MKALSLMEFMQAAPIDNQELYNCLKLSKTYLSPCYQNQMYANYLNQPFTPEMIVEKFKGWDTTLMTQNSKNYANYYGTISLDNDRIYIRGNFMKFTIQNTMPRTLSDFINDCQRAEIELEFKEQ